MYVCMCVCNYNQCKINVCVPFFAFFPFFFSFFPFLLLGREFLPLLGRDFFPVDLPLEGLDLSTEIRNVFQKKVRITKKYIALSVHVLYIRDTQEMKPTKVDVVLLFTHCKDIRKSHWTTSTISNCFIYMYNM